MTETLRTVDGRSVLRIERKLAHPPDKVWRALTEPFHLSQWFPSNMEIDLRVGGTIHFVFPVDEAPPMEGVITDLDPLRVFAYNWGLARACDGRRPSPSRCRTSSSTVSGKSYRRAHGRSLPGCRRGTSGARRTPDRQCAAARQPAG